MKKWIVLFLVSLLFAGKPAAVKADQIDDLKEQLVQQAKILQQMQQKLQQLETRQTQQDKFVEEKVSQAVEAKQMEIVPESLKLAESVKFSGDFRYRHEYTDDETADYTRNRHRIRARLNMDAMVNDEVDVGFTLASGSSDSPTSTNQTLGESKSGEDSSGFSSKEIWLDRALANWHPSWAPDTNFLFGKMSVPFYSVGKNQLIWDGDLRMEGISAKHKFAVGDETSFNVTGGGFWIKEDSGNADISLWGVQGYLDHIYASGNKLTGGVSYYDYGNIQGNSVGGFSSKGNTVSNGLYVSDYDIFEAFGEYGFNAFDSPMSFYGSWVKNVASDTSEDTGWLIGTKFNKAKAPGSWEFSYDYRDIEADAVVGGLNDSDFIGGGTNGTGHRLGFNYQIAKNTQFGLSYFINEKNADTSKDSFNLLQADLVFKF